MRKICTKDHRAGSTVIEALMMIGMVSLVASLSLALVRLTSQAYTSVRSETFQVQQRLRLYDALREHIHGARSISVSQDGTMLALELSESMVATFNLVNDGCEFVLADEGVFLRRDRFTNLGFEQFSFERLADSPTLAIITNEPEWNAVVASGLYRNELSPAPNRLDRSVDDDR